MCSNLEADRIRKCVERCLAELSSTADQGFVLCTGPAQASVEGASLGCGFKVCRVGESPRRLLCLSIDQITSDGSGYQHLKSELSKQLSEFWEPGNQERMKFAYVDF